MIFEIKNSSFEKKIFGITSERLTVVEIEMDGQKAAKWRHDIRRVIDYLHDLSTRKLFAISPVIHNLVHMEQLLEKQIGDRGLGNQRLNEEVFINPFFLFLDTSEYNFF